MGSFLQFSLSYTDMPYQRPEIRSPSTGHIVAEPMDLSFLVEDGALLNKEKKLVELIKKEQEAQEELSALKVKFSGLEQNSGNILENIQRVNTEIVRFEEEKEKLKRLSLKDKLIFNQLITTLL